MTCLPNHHHSLSTSFRSDAGLSLILLLPVLILYLLHGLSTFFTGGLPTWFLQYDQAFYMASAREYADQGSLIFYSNPADPGLHPPAIYFQLPVFLLSILWRITGINPGILLVIFGLASAWWCFLTGVRFWRSYTRPGKGPVWPGLLMFSWGGGLLACGGLLYLLFRGGDLSTLFHFDPTGGWWFQNWGRNMVLPLEAFYHALFLNILFHIYQKKYWNSIVYLLLLALSHPFSGLQATLIMLAWACLKKILFKDQTLSWWHLLSISALLTGQLYYYFIYLQSFSSHREVYEQWQLPLNLGLVPALLAYTPVAIAAIRSSFLKKGRVWEDFNGFLIIAAVVTFLLMFHQWFMQAHQPLHFSRGYLWLFLFLLGYSSFKDLIALFNSYRPLTRSMLTLLFFLLFFLDNLGWFTVQGIHQLKGTSLHLSRDEKEVIGYLKEHTTNQTILFSEDQKMSYLALVYSPVRSYYSHWANTPAIRKKIRNTGLFFHTGQVPEGFDDREVLLLLPVQPKANNPFQQKLSENYSICFQTQDHLIFRSRIPVKQALQGKAFP